MRSERRRAAATNPSAATSPIVGRERLADPGAVAQPSSGGIGSSHFFVKPWAFTETPRGWSSVLDGIRGEGYDVMRGVVWTDRFHATPAVFDVAPMRVVKVASGVPLLEVFAIPRG